MDAILYLLNANAKINFYQYTAKYILLHTLHVVYMNVVSLYINFNLSQYIFLLVIIECIKTSKQFHYGHNNNMADATSYLSRQLRVFLEKKLEGLQRQHSRNLDWDGDWEFYNQFSSLLSVESPLLIPYANSNVYITYKSPNDTRSVSIHNFDKGTFSSLLKEYEGSGMHLVIHVSVWCSTSSNIGHSCLFIFCPKIKAQWFFDPSGLMETHVATPVWRHIASSSIVDGYTAYCLCPCKCFQSTVEDIVGLQQNTCCGILCSMINLQLALTNVQVEDIMLFWRRLVSSPLHRSLLKASIQMFVDFYQRVFIGGDDGDPVL